MSDRTPDSERPNRTIERQFEELRYLARTKRCPRCRGRGVAVRPQFGLNPGNPIEYERCWCRNGRVPR